MENDNRGWTTIGDMVSWLHYVTSWSQNAIAHSIAPIPINIYLSNYSIRESMQVLYFQSFNEWWSTQMLACSTRLPRRKNIAEFIYNSAYYILHHCTWMCECLIATNTLIAPTGTCWCSCMTSYSNSNKDKNPLIQKIVDSINCKWQWMDNNRTKGSSRV